MLWIQITTIVIIKLKSVHPNIIQKVDDVIVEISVPKKHRLPKEISKKVIWLWYFLKRQELRVYRFHYRGKAKYLIGVILDPVLVGSLVGQLIGAQLIGVN